MAEQAQGGAQDTVEDLVAEMRDHLTVGVDGEVLTAPTPTWFGPVMFGGFVVAQAIAAATTCAPDGRRLHSLHAHFLRPVGGGSEVTYRAAMVREGRTFASLRLDAQQAGKDVLTGLASFTSDGDGYVYDFGKNEPLPTLDETKAEPGPGPWEAYFVGPTDPLPDGTRTSTHRMWFRIPTALDDDVHFHTALLGFASDWTGIGGRPLALEGNTTGMISLDHAVWFHRPARADEWLFYDVSSLVNFGGRGLLRGVMRNREGDVVASLAQEMLLAQV